MERKQRSRDQHWKPETRAGGERDIKKETKIQKCSSRVKWQMQKEPTRRREAHAGCPAHLPPSSCQVIDFGSASIFSGGCVRQGNPTSSPASTGPNSTGAALLRKVMCDGPWAAWRATPGLAPLPGQQSTRCVTFVRPQGLPKPHLLHAARKATTSSSATRTRRRQPLAAEVLG